MAAPLRGVAAEEVPCAPCLAARAAQSLTLLNAIVRSDVCVESTDTLHCPYLAAEVAESPTVLIRYAAYTFAALACSSLAARYVLCEERLQGCTMSHVPGCKGCMKPHSADSC